MRLIRAARPGAWIRTPRSRRVLAIVGDTQVGLWVVRSLGRAGLGVLSLCATENGLAAHSRYSAGVWAMDAPAHTPKFIDDIDQLARQFDVGSIMTIAEAFHQAPVGARYWGPPDAAQSEAGTRKST